MLTARQTSGLLAEKLVTERLIARGYEILERNYRCAAGEVDILARDGACYVFVEVRSRRGRSCGTPEASITSSKQQRLVEIAETYFVERGLKEVDWRIDVAAVEWNSSGQLARLEIIVDAVRDVSV